MTCCCMGPQNGEMLCPCQMEWSTKWSKDENNSRFVPLPKLDFCMDFSHNPPSHMVIPQGQMYIHVCPSCKQESRLMAPQIMY